MNLNICFEKMENFLFKVFNKSFVLDVKPQTLIHMSRHEKCELLKFPVCYKMENNKFILKASQIYIRVSFTSLFKKHCALVD